MRCLRTLLVLAVLGSASGCYRYIETDRSTVSPGTEVRASLTDAGSEVARAYFGPDVRSVEGPVVGWDQDELTVLVRGYLSRPGYPPTSVEDTIRLLPEHFRTVEVRTLDGKRTLGLAAAIVGGTVAAVFGTGVFGGGSDEGDEGDNPDPDAAIIVRIPIGGGFR
jgi:hypothetical protein